MSLLGKVAAWIVQAIAGKVAHDLGDTEPFELRRPPAPRGPERELEWNQRQASPKVGDLLERQRRDEIPPRR